MPSIQLVQLTKFNLESHCKRSILQKQLNWLEGYKKPLKRFQFQWNNLLLPIQCPLPSVRHPAVIKWVQGCRKWEGRGGGRPPCPLTGGARGAEGAPPIRKCDIINIHISLNLRRIQKENDTFFILGAKVHQIFYVLIVFILTTKKTAEYDKMSLSRDCRDSFLTPWMPLSRDSPPLP